MKAIIYIFLLFNIPIFFQINNYEISLTSISDEKLFDFAPIKYKGGILFSSKVSSLLLGREQFRLFYAEIVDNELLADRIEIKCNNLDEFAHFNPGYYLEATDEFYFTKSFTESRPKKIVKLAVYKGKLKDFELTDIEVLSFNDPQNNYAYPTLSNDGKQMIISSDQDGSMDLYEYTREDVSKEWQLKRKLDELNSSYLELYPTFVNDTTLVFVSDDEIGLGGLDFYKSEKINEYWDFPENLELLNSGKDETGIFMMDDFSGYFSSNRDSNWDHIYFFGK